MPKYRKKPVTIEARQLVGPSADFMDVYQWVESNTLGSFDLESVIAAGLPYPQSGVSIDPADGRIVISTLEGLHWADPNDYIIRGVQGEFYPCKPGVFELTYEAVDE